MTAWWFDIDPGDGGVEPDLDAAIWQSLSSLRLSGPVIARSPFDDPRFGAAALNATSEPAAWAADLERCARAWFGIDASLEDANAFMHQLRTLGHPL